jgi:c(7)-type cytochrome triheme protein
MKRLILIALLFLALAGIAVAQTGMKKKRPLPYDYGKVVLNNFSEKAGLSPVVFDHWIHRSKFTCRLCHVDIAFAMKADSTAVKASDNMHGYYCGTCHNGKMVFEGKKVFESCSKKIPQYDDIGKCERCHSLGKNVVREYDFAKFTERFPKERFGNGVDWEKAEADGHIKLVDFLEGVSIKRPNLAIQKDFSLAPKVEGMPDIVFSHKKHTVWNGCELCHPEIFIGVKKGATKYSMVEIYEGKYCGVCHSAVAFPLLDCQRCHSKPVQ